MDDERLSKIEQERQNALNASNSLYEGLLKDNETLLNQQNEYANNYEKTQNELLDKQLTFNEEQINKQKEIARENMETESKKAKNDYTAFVNPYGYQAEQFASNGLLNSGVSETSKLGGWNTYQNRLASANKAMQDAFVQYDTEMNEARLANDAQKAQNALDKLKMQLEFQQNFYSNKADLSQTQLAYNQSLDSEYFNRYQTEYGNIQNERAREEAIRQWEAEMAEKQRQYNESLAYQKERDAVSDTQWQKQYELSKRSVDNTILFDDPKPSTDDLGNSKETTNKEDFYFKNANGDDYQPRYIKNYRLEKIAGGADGAIKLKDIGTIKGVSGNKHVWKAGNEYYVWDENHYIDVTNMVKKFLKG